MSKENVKQEEEEFQSIPFEMTIKGGEKKEIKFPEDDFILLINKAKVTRKGKAEVTLDLTMNVLPDDVDPNSSEPTQYEESTQTICDFKNDEEELECVVDCDQNPQLSVKGSGTVTVSGTFTFEPYPEEEDFLEEEQGKEQ